MTPLFAEIVEWAPLLEAIVASAVFGLTVLALGSIAVFASLRAQDERGEGHESAVLAFGGVTVVCVVLIAAAIALGIWAMTQ